MVEMVPLWEEQIKVGKYVKTIAVPNELIMRAHDTNRMSPTLEWLIEEAKHVVELVESGDSCYADDEDDGKSIRRECKQFVKKYGKLAGV